MSQSFNGRGGGTCRRPGGWQGRGRGWRGRGSWNSSGQGAWSKQGNRGNWQRGRGVPSIQSSHPRIVQSTLLDFHTPYKAWTYYFPDQGYSDNSPIVKRTKVFEKYLSHWKDRYNVTDLEAKRFFTVDYKDMCSDPIITEGLIEFSHDIQQSPETSLNCIGLAMHQVMSVELAHEHQDDISLANLGSQPLTPTVGQSQFPTLPKLQCRILNYGPITSLKNLKANYYGKFVTIKGTVVRVSNIKPMCTKMAFECSSCSAVQVVLLPDGKYVVPVKCPSGECRGRTFQPLRSHEQTETIDWQTIRLQEIMDDDQRESGRIPRTVDCEFTSDLVDSCVPGDMVTVSGVVKVINSDEGRGRQKDKCMFLLYLHANSVANAKGVSKTSEDGNQSTSGLGIEFTMKELYAIEEIHSQMQLYRLIVGSVCPGIYGHEMVKAGLVLGLFGGSQKYANDSNRIPVRGDPHILVVGDPGLGKSQMLQAVANVAPRSVYVCGNTTTTSGLTVTLCKEGGGHGDYALEAGALVLADQGCCCIDEFDKMGNQHQALLEAMEQQSISIAKAGIVCSLPARTSILAAANPAGGHYNKAKTVSENLRMGSALLSRFDLVFILLDKPDEEMDSMLSEHVMALHAGKKRRFDSSLVNATPRTQAEADALAQWEAEKPLSERLKVPRGEQLDLIPPQLLRKYVGYARKYVHPKISPEAAQIIQKFYLDLRKKHQTQDSTPITTRQLESLIRLTESRARLELREVASENDARDVIEIMKNSMIDTYSDDQGFLNFTRSQHGSGMSKKGQAKKLVALLQQISETTCNSLFTVQEMRQIAQEAKLNIPDFEQFVSSMNNQGYLLKKGPRVFQLQTAGY